MTKFCVDCKHYQPATSAGKPRIVHSPALCLLPVLENPVTGAAIRYTCRSRRAGDQDKCGEEGKLFEPKMEPPRGPDYKKQMLEPVAGFLAAVLGILLALLIWRIV